MPESENLQSQAPTEATEAILGDSALSTILPESNMSKEDRQRKEIDLIMQLPEVTQDLFLRANPNRIDLYDSAFTTGGELESYATYIHKKLITLKENQDYKEQKILRQLQQRIGSLHAQQKAALTERRVPGSYRRSTVKGTTSAA